jgi:hypothetical protein
MGSEGYQKERVAKASSSDQDFIAVRCTLDSLEK